MQITAQWLADYGATSGEIELFQHEWPEGCILSLETLQRAIELKLDVNWLAGKILALPAWRSGAGARELALKVYTEIQAPARKVYQEVCAAALWKALGIRERKIP